ncbi:MAG TPA: hypothetical protein VMZ02_06595 [Candidatus Limnocylindrales bacterium]|nr:hypothetical protein [Candidatus Limnocylindrales bacterium]
MAVLPGRLIASGQRRGKMFLRLFGRSFAVGMNRFLAVLEMTKTAVVITK